VSVSILNVDMSDKGHICVVLKKNIFQVTAEYHMNM
jgi:hypothetical protein